MIETLTTTDPQALATLDPLAAQVAQLTAALAQVTAMAKDAPHPYAGVVIHEKRVHTSGANLAEPLG